tara:strand:+ start:187 stop:1017 length:831 start_codon:yes stop_codon:yes gene_type:complete
MTTLQTMTTLQSIVIQAHDTNDTTRKQNVLSFMNPFTKIITNMFPGNVCNIFIGGCLLPCTIQYVSLGFVTVTIQVSPDVYIDKPILFNNFEKLSAMVHNVDHMTTVLSVGAFVGMRHQYVGEIYFGIVVHIEPINHGVHVRFENGDFVKYKKETFSPTSKVNGEWCFVEPFTLMCDTYKANASTMNHMEMDNYTDISCLINTTATNTVVGAVDAVDAVDANIFDANIVDATTSEPIDIDQSAAFDALADFDSFVFDESIVDEACNNADLMDELFP